MEVACSSEKSMLTYDAAGCKQNARSLSTCEYESLKTYMQLVLVYVSDWPIDVYIFRPIICKLLLVMRCMIL